MVALDRFHMVSTQSYSFAHLLDNTSVSVTQLIICFLVFPICMLKYGTIRACVPPPILVFALNKFDIISTFGKGCNN